MDHVDIAVVGAGPTGLALAAELRLAGATCRVLERRATEPNLTRAFAVHARTLELLDGRGLADDLIPRGIRVERVTPAPGADLDLSTLDSPYGMVLIVPQNGTEDLLERRARELGAEIVRGAEVVGLAQDDDGVTLDLADGGQVRARYVVGTDGAHSAVRRLVGVDFVGEQYQTHIMLADVQLGRPPAETLFGATTVDGLTLFVPFGDGWFRAIVWDRRRDRVPLDEPVTRAELRDAFRRIAGDDFDLGEPRWRTRFLSERRQARHYRVGRVFLAGDAAHVHSPVGGQGMNTGIQDALNLGWKLGAAVAGRAPDGLLDTYEAERHPVGAAVLAITDAFTKLVLSGSRAGLAVRRAIIRTVLHLPPARRAVAGRISGLRVRYPRPAGAHPSTGRRLPHSGDDGRAVYDALRAGRFVLVDRGGDATGRAAGWADRLTPVRRPARSGAPEATLVRPDGYVAWAGRAADLAAALPAWCGPAAAVRR
jgi:2-polyprenyl-6-methoxyphenol hydroxylase-like FAD-dependent oxidoreductase